MSFISYNLNYYGDALTDMENNPSSAERVYRAKQLLKFVDDITDEGYPDLRNALEDSLRGVSRLREYIISNNDSPFPVRFTDMTETPIYNEETHSFDSCIDGIIRRAANVPPIENDFLRELKAFSDWLGTDEDATYVFLMRDTLLPYARLRHKQKCEAWLLGRKMICALTGNPSADDDIVRCVINDALESGNADSFDTFREYCTPKIIENLKPYPAFTNAVKNLLANIKTDKIIVVESGCYGTFPMLLMALDERVDVRMFTAIPMLVSAYGERLFTPAYEKNRWFETMYSQDVLLRYAKFENGKFYMQKCENQSIAEKAYGEISYMII